MMVPKKSLLFAGAALLCTGAATTAQQDAPMLRRVTKPLIRAEMDLQTGTVTRGPAVRNKGFNGYNTASSLNNLDHSGFVGVDSGPGTPNGPCEWFSAANKGGGNTGGRSTFVTGFAFAYCSAAQDPLSGGVGGKAIVGFREGYMKGSPNNLAGLSGTLAGSFNLSGLPAWTGCSSFFGGFSCYLMAFSAVTQVGNDAQPVCLPDTNIGWSYQFRDLGTDGVLAKTFPFIACVQSCTGTGPDSTGGMIDFVDQYCPAGQPLSTFTFGTGAAGSYYTSISMDIREAVAIAASTTSYNKFNSAGPFAPPPSPPHVGSNPNILTPVAGPILGGAYSLNLDCSGSGDPTKSAIFRIGFAPGAGPPGSNKFGEILVPLQGFIGVNFVFPFPHGSSPSFGFGPPGGLPKDITFYNACWRVQAFCGDTPKGFNSNALVQTMGSF
jgi:hypothetical protein